MNNSADQMMNLEEICQVTLLTTEVVIEIVQYGIIEPIGDNPDQWQFDTEMVARVHKATRMRKDLEINWPGVALALELIEKLDKLRCENQMLEQRLNRFLATTLSDY